MLAKEKGYSNKYIISDIMVGIVIALVSIPISMGYALVAGLPVKYGLYGSIFPILLFAFISGSPRFVFGVDAAPAALVGGILASLGITAESEEAIRLVPVITLITGLWLLFFFLIRASRILKFISQPVVGGFITGIGVTIICMQIPKLFGGSSGRGEIIELLSHIYEEARDGVSVLSLILGISTVVIILLFKHFAPMIPMSGICVFIGALLEYAFDLSSEGVKLLPAVKNGFPKITAPDLTLLSGRFTEIVVPSLTIAMVILAETLLATSNLARKHDERLRPRRENLAYSVCNLAAAFIGCCPVNGSVSRSGMADQYKVRSQIMSVTAGLAMLLIVLFGTGFISYLPVPILTGIVISALIGTFEFSLAHKLKKIDKTEFLIFYAAFFTVLIFGTIYGVFVGIILSAVTFISRASNPTTAFLGVVPDIDGFHSLSRMKNSRPIKGVIIYRFTGALFYANIDRFQQDIEDAVKEDIRLIIIDAGTIGSIDLTAAERIMNIYNKYKERNISFYIAGHVDTINDMLRTYGAGELIRTGHVKPRIIQVLNENGITAPYTFEDDYEPAPGKASRRLAEFEWAYGSDADKIMQNLASEIASRIIDDPDFDIEKDDFDINKYIRQAEDTYGGHWNIVDEEELLELLEIQLAIMIEEGRTISSRTEILTSSAIDRIDSRLFELKLNLELKIMEKNKPSIERILKRRLERDAAMKKSHPKAYNRIVEERAKALNRLKENNPALAREIELIRNNLS
ncbi:MAG: SulP family inorganic anion transporter [Eubacterium sp.]|nr:SulP family inorganic anion transporter [Eubacterium sp.]